MSENEMLALFLLARIPVERAWKLANGYCGDACCPDKPWWLVSTPFGLVKVGWRKRVINIDWEATLLREVLTNDDVTKDETHVHAWGYAKAVEYLTTLARRAERLPAVPTGKPSVAEPNAPADVSL